MSGMSHCRSLHGRESESNEKLNYFIAQVNNLGFNIYVHFLFKVPLQKICSTFNPALRFWHHLCLTVNTGINETTFILK